MTPLRILHVRSASFYGGPEKLILGQIREQKIRVSSSVTLFKDGADTSFEDACLVEGVPTIALKGISELSKLARAIRQHQADIVCTHDYKSNFLTWLVSFFVSFKQIAVFHGRTAHNLKSRFYEAMDSIVLERVAAIVAVSKATKKQLARYGERARVIPNAFAGVEDIAAGGRDFRAEWGADTEAVVVGTAGRLSSEKGHQYLIEAMKEIHQGTPRVLVVVAGEGEEKDRLMEAARRAGIEGGVRFLGFNRDMKSFYKALDIFVLPSDREGLPLALLEAASAGNAIVATDVGGVRELIEDGRSGRVVPPGDPKGLADALWSLINNKEERLRLGEAARKSVREDFSIETYARRFVDLYTSVLTEDAVWMTWEPHRRTREIVQSLGIRLFEVNSPVGGLGRYAYLISRTFGILRRARPRVVLVQCPSLVLAVFLLLLKRFLRFRLIVDAHNEAVLPYNHNTLLVRSLVRFIHRRSDLCIVTNDSLKTVVEHNGGRAFVLPDKIPNLPAAALTANPNGQKRIVFICTYAPDEPVDRMVAAARFLPENVYLHITGNVKKADPQLIKSAPSNVRFTGFLSEEAYEDELREASVIVDLTEMEDCLVCGAYEAVALEKPLVTSDTQALRRYFSKGALYARHDSRSLANSMIQALEGGTGLAEEMGELKPRLNEEWENSFQKLRAALRNL